MGRLETRFNLFAMIGAAMLRRPNDDLGWILTQACSEVSAYNAGNASDEDLLLGLQRLEILDIEGTHDWR